MKTTLLLTASILMILSISCAPKSDTAEVAQTADLVDLSVNDGWDSFGEVILAADYVSLDEVIDGFSQESEQEMKISGTLKTVCQSKGCWTIMEASDGRTVRMTFANYGFFLPTDAAGRAIIAEGLAFKKVSSVAEQRHYLEDNNASESDILAITEPKIEYSFEATGVLLR